jgi:hypothetical protein
MRHNLNWIVILFLFASLKGFPAQRGLPVATIHIEAVGPFGAPIRDAVVRLLTTDRKRDLSAVERAPTISNVPYGEYIVVASDRGGAVAEREIIVNANEVWVRIGLGFPTGNRAWPGGDLSISGDLVPCPADLRNWWVRIEGVFLHFSRESPLLDRGRFSITGLEMGTYLVEIFEGGKLRYAEALDIDTKEPHTHLRISLPRREPSGENTGEDGTYQPVVKVRRLFSGL